MGEVDFEPRLPPDFYYREDWGRPPRAAVILLPYAATKPVLVGVYPCEYLPAREGLDRPNTIHVQFPDDSPYKRDSSFYYADCGLPIVRGKETLWVLPATPELTALAGVPDALE